MVLSQVLCDSATIFKSMKCIFDLQMFFEKYVAEEFEIKLS